MEHAYDFDRVIKKKKYSRNFLLSVEKNKKFNG